MVAVTLYDSDIEALEKVRDILVRLATDAEDNRLIISIERIIEKARGI